jgi:hypothetical protein
VSSEIATIAAVRVAAMAAVTVIPRRAGAHGLHSGNAGRPIYTS